MHSFAKTQPGDSGEHVTAQNDRSGEIRYCVNCDCEMYRRLSKLRKPHYACRPGHKHRDENCKRIASSLTTLDLDMTNPIEFHKFISTPPAPGSDGGGLTGPRKPREDVEKFVAFRSLKNFIDCGLVHAKNNLAFKHGRLSDILINSHFAPLIMQENNSLGYRVLWARPITYFWHEQYIRFLMFGVIREGGHEARYQKIFDFHFSERTSFLKQTEQIFNATFMDGSKKPIVSSKYKYILVHGIWHATEYPKCQNSKVCGRTECNGTWKCTGHQYAEYTSSRQIYCPPDQKIDKK